MFLTPDDTDLTREEAARALSIPVAAIDALVQHGVLTTKNNALPLRALEEFFRDSLLRLYHAQATEAPKVKEDNVIRSMDRFQEEAKPKRGNDRIAPRYEPAQPIEGSFRDTRFSVLQISATGLRIRHEETLRPGDEQRVSIALSSTRSIHLKARVVWSSIGSAFCVSGLRVTANIDHLLGAIDTLKKARILKTEGTATGAKKTPPALVGLSDDVVASIIRAHRRFSSDPVEAGKWYARVRVSLTDESVRRVAEPMKARDREEVLGIWEYLERKVEVDDISNVVSWLRQTRSAAAV
jgi:hypothetical protein